MPLPIYGKKSIFFIIFYEWGPQDIVLLSSNFAITFKIMYIYEFYLTQCLKISVIIYNIDNIHINR